MSITCFWIFVAVFASLIGAYIGVGIGYASGVNDGKHTAEKELDDVFGKALDNVLVDWNQKVARNGITTDELLDGFQNFMNGGWKN